MPTSATLVDENSSQQRPDDAAEKHEALLRAGRALKARIKVDYDTRLGEGAFGTVYAAAFAGDHAAAGAAEAAPICVKAVSTAKLSSRCVLQLRRELALHAQVRHAHILPMLGAYQHSPTTLHLVLRRARGDLAVALRHAPAAVRTLAPRLLAQLLRALEHLHGDDVVHSDVKPGNCLLDGEGSLLLCDLGAAARIGGGGRSTLVGSPAYLAPEVVAIGHLGLQVSGGATYAYAADLWSAGVVLVEALSGALPFPAEPRDAAAQPAAICFRPPRLPDDACAEGRSLALQLLAKQAYLRPTAAEARASPFLRRAAEDAGAGPPTADEAAPVAACLACLASRRFEIEHGVEAAPPPAAADASADDFATPRQKGRHTHADTESESRSASSGGEGEGEGDSPCSMPSWASSLVEESP